MGEGRGDKCDQSLLAGCWHLLRSELRSSARARPGERNLQVGITSSGLLGLDWLGVLHAGGTGDTPGDSLGGGGSFSLTVESIKSVWVQVSSLKKRQWDQRRKGAVLVGGSRETVLANRCSACTAGAELGFGPWEQGNITASRDGSEMG